MICPKCKCEYREGFTHCRDCNIDLVEQLESDCDNDSNTPSVSEELNLTKVINVANDFEAWTIIDLLEKHNITCIRKDREAGGYLRITMGYSVFGIDIYVNEKDYDEAIELISNLPAKSDIVNEDTQEPEGSAFTNKKRILFARIWLVVILLLFIFVLLVNHTKIF